MYKVRNIPNIENENELSDRLISSISKFTGWDKERILNGSEHKTVFWRKIASYILIEKFDWTSQAAADLFGQKAENAWMQHKWVEEALKSEDKSHDVLPYVNKVYHDLTL